MNALEVKVTAQLVQRADVMDLAAKLGAEKRPKELENEAHKVGGMHQKEFLEILLVLAIEGSIRLPQPRNRRLVLARQALVEVHQRVVILHVSVQRAQQIPKSKCNLYIQSDVFVFPKHIVCKHRH